MYHGIDVYKSFDMNSCPEGYKIFSPRTKQDWAAIWDNKYEYLARVSSPHLIIDVTRPEDGCGDGCTSYAMNSDVPAQATYVSPSSHPCQRTQPITSVHVHLLPAPIC